MSHHLVIIYALCLLYEQLKHMDSFGREHHNWKQGTNTIQWLRTGQLWDDRAHAVYSTW